MNHRRRVAFSSLLLCLTACASDQAASDKGKPPESKDVFATYIDSDGIKRFSYSMTPGVPARSRGGRHGGGRGGGMGGQHASASTAGFDSDASDTQSSTNNPLHEETRSKLEEKLNATHYCREGYNESDSRFDKGTSQIWGACNETATDQDRKNFPNT